MASKSKINEKYTEFLNQITSKIRIRHNEPLYTYTTLRVGGLADLFYSADDVNDLAHVAAFAHQYDIPILVLGWGSNVCISDKGYRGLVIRNMCESIKPGSITYAECGASLQELFLKTAQHGLSGLEFAVGIPGTVGGALVSNAGAYRNNIDKLVTAIDLVHDGERKQVTAEWMGFSYRDSVMRSSTPPKAVLLSVDLQLTITSKREIFHTAHENQHRRIASQPCQPSAGSYFKNINNLELAKNLPGLKDELCKSGVVPAAFIIESMGLKGLEYGGAAVSSKHANFLINKSSAVASDFWNLAQEIKKRIFDKHGVWLQEEVLYAGEWSESETCPKGER